ncbi:MAG TPA: patatin-like phospholipase family protein [Acidimicrobiales bacterium]|nr:patatin-like phospholipase family protein [Acidimicrobiales bacterium]
MTPSRLPDVEAQARRAGTRLGGVTPCPTAGEPARKLEGPEPRFALALSGGGFRASLAALGVLRFFASAGLLGNVKVVSSVSGSSVTNGLFAVRHRQIAAKGYSLEAFDTEVTVPLFSSITQRSLTANLVANVWKAVGPLTRTDLLARALDGWFYRGATMDGLSTECDFVINATNLNTSVRFGFQQQRVGDYVIGFTKPSPTLKVADAVAASAAVPGVFAPVTFRGHRYPCDPGYPPQLVDGGVYDNLGIEPIVNLASACLVVLNAGGVFRVGKFHGVPVVRNLARSSSVQYRQTTALRMKDLVDDYRAWEEATGKGTPPPATSRQGVVFGLGTTMKTPAPAWTHDRPVDPDPGQLEDLPTSFGRFSPDDAGRLIERGWWLTGASLATYHPDLLPTLPAVPPIPPRGPT